MQARRGWKEVFQVMKDKDLHPRLLYPAKLSFRMEGQIKCFPDKVKLKDFIITKPLLHEMLKRLIKKKIKTVNIKRATNSQLQLNLKNKLSKQPEQEQNHRYGDHWEGCQLGGGRGRMGGKVQGIRSVVGRYKIDRGMLKIV